MTKHAVATPHGLSVEAGRHILDAGGNAVDAAIAAVVAQGVVAPETCGIGGDLFALVHRPGWDRPQALNASGRSGSHVQSRVLREAGHTAVPRDHPLTVTIPGCVDGLVELSAHLGTMALDRALQPAIELAEEGFAVSKAQASAFSRLAGFYTHNPAVSDFYSGGKPVQTGELVTRADLAGTLGRIAEGGREAFYQGIPGEDISAAVDGLITIDDMESIQAEWIDPIGLEVAGLTAWTTPPNSQGYLGPASLAVFEMLEPPADPDDPAWWHLLIESYRCLAWERNDVVSDPEFVSLPAHLLLDNARLKRAAASVDHQRAGVWPERMGATGGTAYLAVADSEGLAVSIIQSNYRGTGSPFGAARSGFLLQDRGGGFSLTEGHPNELGPGKRPLHTLSPTLWTDGDQPRWILGTRGGAVQPQLIAQVAARAILGDTGLAEAQSAPRWTISDFGPFSRPHLLAEHGIPAAVLSDLTTKGHQIEEMDRPQPGWGPLSIVEIDEGARRAASDPRGETASALVF